MSTETTTASHTPGPWRVVETNRLRQEVFVGRGGQDDEAAHESIARILRSPNDKHGDVRQANARLIAAAPELLAALKAIEFGNVTVADRERAYRAIAKAEGHSDS